MNGSRAYNETTVTVTANTNVLVAPFDCGRNRVILSDPAGLGCQWTLNANAAATEGVVFSVSGSPGSYVFDLPAPSNPLYVRASANGVVTVVIG